MGHGRVARVLAGILACALPFAPGAARAAGDFYKGKTIELDVGYSVGGGYDLYARVLARHLGQHIPGNPTIVPKNMEGAGSLRLANWLYRVAPKDGTVIGTIGRGIAFDPLLGNPGAQFQATRFTWLGSANHEVSVCVAWHDAGVSRFEDLLTHEITVGGTGPGADTDEFPKALDGVLGTKMKIVSGYPGGNDVLLAMERGEVQGRCGWSWSSVLSTRPGWVKDKKIAVLVQLALRKHPELPDIPLVLDFAKTPEQTQILKLIFARQVMGRPFLAPPGLPEDRAAILRQAFLDTLHDPDFLADAGKAQIEINPVPGAEVEQVVADAYATPPDLVKKAAAFSK